MLLANNYLLELRTSHGAKLKSNSIMDFANNKLIYKSYYNWSMDFYITVHYFLMIFMDF